MGVIVGNGQAQTGLGGAAGFGELALARSDDASFAINVAAVFENGFTLGGRSYSASSLFVATDGFLSFGRAPAPGYQRDPNSLSSPFIAAFMADIDTRLDGEGRESGPIWVDIDPVADVVTVTWQNVGFYRRNADLTNTFQIQLFDRGAAGMDVVFRYASIRWTSGDLQGGWDGLGGEPAYIGMRATASGPIGWLDASGDSAAQRALSTSLGNTGVAGLWVFNLPGSGNIGGLPPPQIAPGGATADVLTGTSAEDTLLGNAGNDVLNGGAGGDLLDGGANFDIASYAGARRGVVASLASPAINTNDAAGDSYYAVEGLLGSSYADVLYGNGLANSLDGGAGNDTLIGGLGADTLMGGTGFDWVDYSAANSALTVSLTHAAQNAGYARGDELRHIEAVIGGAFNDLIIGASGGQELIGGAGDDTLLGGAGADTLRGGAGRDWASYETAAALTIDLQNMARSTGDASGDVLEGIEGLIGSNGADRLRGYSAATMLAGRGGDDLLEGGTGHDSLWGDSGNDTLLGGLGQDRLTGGDGIDFASYSSARSAVAANLANRALNKGDALGDTYAQIEGLIGSAFHDTLTGDSAQNYLIGGTGHDVIYGGNGADDLRAGHGNDSVFGDAGNDVIFGGDHNDVLTGNDGADRIYGDSGADRLFGNSGNDLLYGGNGNDTVTGSGGRDILYGGAERDVFRFISVRDLSVAVSATDVIHDFRRGTDKIDLSGIDASTKIAGNNRFTFDGKTPHGTSKDGDVYYKQVNNAGTRNDFTLIYIDNDADRSSEAVLKVMGLHSFSASDFIL